MSDPIVEILTTPIGTLHAQLAWVDASLLHLAQAVELFDRSVHQFEATHPATTSDQVQQPLHVDCEHVQLGQEHQRVESGSPSDAVEFPHPMTQIVEGHVWRSCLSAPMTGRLVRNARQISPWPPSSAGAACGEELTEDAGGERDIGSCGHYPFPPLLLILVVT
jgi:hypothetical protein